MNRILIILLAAIGLSMSTKAESLPYESMLKDGNTWWIYSYTGDVNDPQIQHYELDFHRAAYMYKLKIEGDTIVEGINYKKLYLYYDSGNYIIKPHLLALMRDGEGKTVYAVQVKEYIDLIIPDTFVEGPYFEKTGERLLYDFDDPLRPFGRSKYDDIDNFNKYYQYIDMEMTNGNTRRYLKTGGLGVAEGIGWMSGVGISNFLNPRPSGGLKCTCGSQCVMSFENAEHENEYKIHSYMAEYLWADFENYFKWLELMRGNSGVANLKIDNAQIRYANGAIDISLEANPLRSSAMVSIIGIDGQIIKTIPVTEAKTEIPTSSLTQGTYIVQLRYDNRQINKKIVITRP